MNRNCCAGFSHWRLKILATRATTSPNHSNKIDAPPARNPSQKPHFLPSRPHRRRGQGRRRRRPPPDLGFPRLPQPSRPSPPTLASRLSQLSNVTSLPRAHDGQRRPHRRPPHPRPASAAAGPDGGRGRAEEFLFQEDDEPHHPYTNAAIPYPHTRDPLAPSLHLHDLASAPPPPKRARWLG
jgi:hypothetical protein